MEVFIRKVVFVILICDFCKVLFDKNYVRGIPKINISVLVSIFEWTDVTYIDISMTCGCLIWFKETCFNCL